MIPGPSNFPSSESRGVNYAYCSKLRIVANVDFSVMLLMSLFRSDQNDVVKQDGFKNAGIKWANISTTFFLLIPFSQML